MWTRFWQLGQLCSMSLQDFTHNGIRQHGQILQRENRTDSLTRSLSLYLSTLLPLSFSLLPFILFFFLLPVSLFLLASWSFLLFLSLYFIHHFIHLCLSACLFLFFSLDRKGFVLGTSVYVSVFSWCCRYCVQ